MHISRFEPRKSLFKKFDLLHVLVLGGLGGFVFVNRADLERLGPTRPTAPDQPWILSPTFKATVSAGIVKFQGTGPSGAKVQIVEGQRIVGESWVKDGKWALSGKLFNSGTTAVQACVVNGSAKKSPLRHFMVTGQAKQTLLVTTPPPGAVILPGKTTLTGTGKAGDELIIFYNEVLIGKVVAGKDEKWTKVVKVSEPKKEGAFKVVSKSEGETVLLIVHGG